MKYSSLYPLIVLIAFAAALTGMQPAHGFQNQPIPRHKPDGDPRHDSQPEFCTNEDGPWIANCKCQAEMQNGDSCKKPDDEYGPDSRDEDDMPRCGVHCRRDKCECRRHCTS